MQTVAFQGEEDGEKETERETERKRDVALWCLCDTDAQVVGEQEGTNNHNKSLKYNCHMSQHSEDVTNCWNLLGQNLPVKPRSLLIFFIKLYPPFLTIKVPKAAANFKNAIKCMN